MSGVPDGMTMSRWPAPVSAGAESVSPADTLPVLRLSRNSAAVPSSGSRWRRQRCGSDLKSSETFWASMPGTSHSQRSASTWLSACSGTVSVTPSSAAPGSK